MRGSGYGVSATTIAQPDAGIITFSEMVETGSAPAKGTHCITVPQRLGLLISDATSKDACHLVAV